MLTRLLARRCERGGTRFVRDAGVTLMELMMAMVLSTAVGAMTLYLFISVNDSTAATTDETINTSSARNTIQAWTDYLGVSDGTVAGDSRNRFEWMGANDVLFYADLFNRTSVSDTVGAPTLVWLRQDGEGHLVEEQFPSTAVAGTSPNVCRVLSFKANAGTSTRSNLFTPANSLGDDLSSAHLGAVPDSGPGCQTLPETPPSASGLTDSVAITNLKSIVTVEIAFTTIDTTGKHTQEFDSVVTLPPLGATS